MTYFFFFSAVYFGSSDPVVPRHSEIKTFCARALVQAGLETVVVLRCRFPEEKLKYSIRHAYMRMHDTRACPCGQLLRSFA